MHGTLRVEIIQSKKCNIVKYMLRQIKNSKTTLSGLLLKLHNSSKIKANFFLSILKMVENAPSKCSQ